jgi:membrane-bound serine protease (ClpP class)
MFGLSALDPNLAYVFLVSFFFLAGIAILTPGTGVLEAGALISLILAGWGVYTLPVNTWALILLALGVLPFIFVVRQSKREWYLIVSIVSLVVGSMFLFSSGTWWKPAVNPFLALITSGLVGGFFWLVTIRTLEAEASPPAHDMGRLVGAVGEAKTDLKGTEEEGSVQVLGELWSARSSTPISAGKKIRVTGRMGFVLEVEPYGED